MFGVFLWDKRRIKIKKNSHLRDFARYASLNVLGMIGVSCYILADTFFVAKGMGADGVTALNIAIPIYSLIHGTGLMIGMGGATKFAIYKSQGRDEAGSRVFTCALLMALVLVFLNATCKASWCKGQRCGHD